MKLLFWKKSSNRKVSRRPRLYRMRRSLMDWGMLTVKVTMTLLAGWGLYHFFVVSDYFKVREVLVQGDLEHVDVETVLKAAGVQKGENIFATNLFGIAQNVKKIPWINHIQVRRQLPSGLVIRVDEHQPFAVLAARKEGEAYNYYLMSREGALFKRGEPSEQGLPLISGFEEAGLRKYPGYFSAPLRQVHDFLKAYETQADPAFEMKQIHFDQNLGMTGFIWSKDHARFMRVYFGTLPTERELNLLNRLIHTMKGENVFYSKLDLHVKGKVFARL